MSSTEMKKLSEPDPDFCQGTQTAEPHDDFVHRHCSVSGHGGVQYGRYGDSDGTSNQLNKNGNWHIMVKDISPETAAELAAQEDVAAFSAYSDINASLTENYFAGDKRAALVGADDAILQIFPGMQCSTARRMAKCS